MKLSKLMTAGLSAGLFDMMSASTPSSPIFLYGRQQRKSKINMLNASKKAKQRHKRLVK
jgi:hypothetical protein